MERKRLAPTERKDAILKTAIDIFAARGYDGARTREIAAAAGISEALLFQYFPTKRALFRAAVRKQVAEQDLGILHWRNINRDGDRLVQLIASYLRLCVAVRGEPWRGAQLLISSLAGNASYARFAYRRAFQQTRAMLTAAIEAAQQDGSIIGTPIATEDAFAFIDSVGLMMVASHRGQRRIMGHVADDDTLFADALRFCARGLGLTEAALADEIAIGPKPPAG